MLTALSSNANDTLAFPASAQQALRNPHTQAQWHIPDLAHLAQRSETGAQVSGERPRVIGGTGINRHTPRSAPPRGVYGAAQKREAHTRANCVRHKPEITQVDVRPTARIEFKEPGRLTTMIERMDRYGRIAQQHGEFFIEHRAAQPPHI